ncbi:MAG: outer membrane beta-barrel protein [Vulcanimicrobiaceae bacterium]
MFDAATGPFFDANGGRQLAGPNDFNNSPNLQNANLQATINGAVFSAKFEGSFGTDADVIASNGQSRSGTNLTQGYVQGVKGPFTLILGKFETLAGAEVIENNSSSNFNVTRSYLFGEAIPFTHTGARLSYAANSKATIIVGANNGWDDWKFVGKPLTLEAGLALTPSPGWALNLQTYHGNDFDGFPPAIVGRSYGYTQRGIYDGVLTVHPTGALTLVANYDNGTQLSNGASPTIAPGVANPLHFGTAHWNGFAGYAKYQFNSRYALALRKETFGDPEGFRTGIAQRLQSSTATAQFTPNSNWIFRAEYRVDTSDVPSFFDNNTPTQGTGRQHQNSFALESIVQFP